MVHKLDYKITLIFAKFTLKCGDLLKIIFSLTYFSKWKHPIPWKIQSQRIGWFQTLFLQDSKKF